jgi:hypothetical protein
MFTLIDNTASKSWDYDSEAQLKMVTRLYAMQHPKASLSVVVSGQQFKVR